MGAAITALVRGLIPRLILSLTESVSTVTVLGIPIYPSRGVGSVLSERDINATNVPLRVFLYTIDQLATMLNVTEQVLKDDHLYYHGRSTGYQSKWLMHAVNVAPPGTEPEWRVADKELIRWLKFKGFRIIERGYVSK